MYDIKLIAIKACLLASLFPYLLSLMQKTKNKLVDILVLFIFLILGIWLSNRAFIISILGIFIYCRYFEYPVVRSRYLYGFLVILSLVLLILKFDSLTGRWFIWKNIFSNISTVPLTGLGYESFKETYAQWQATYFQIHPNWSKFHLVADSPSFAFNEALHYYIEFGFTSVLIFFILVFVNVKCLFQKNRDLQKPIVLSNLVILFFSLISYPLHSMWALALLAFNHFALLLARYFKTKTAALVAIALATTGSIFILYERGDQSIEKWEDARVIPVNYPDEKKEAYKQAYNELSKNQYFLNDYCLFLLTIQCPDSVLYIASANKRFMNQYEYSLVMANAYLQKKEYDKAETFLKTASNIIPNRFIPFSQLMEMELERNNLISAKEYARKIIAMPVKIASPKVDFIKNRAMELLNRKVYK